MILLFNQQLNSGTTTFNATLNLTGHILLGLGIASSLLLYMFFNAFDTVGGGDDYGFARNKVFTPGQHFRETVIWCIIGLLLHCMHKQQDIFGCLAEILGCLGLREAANLEI